MTKAIRWSDDELKAYKNRRASRALEALAKVPAPEKVPDLAPPLASVSGPRDAQWTKDEIAAMAASKAAPFEFNKIVRAPEPAVPKKPAKYRNTKVEVDGIVHDSGKEARRWAVLQQQVAAGEITDLKRQQSFVLAPAVRLAGEPRKKPALRYFSDFTYLRDAVLIVEDTKSRPTRKLAAYRIKKHLMATVHNIQIKEV